MSIAQAKMLCLLFIQSRYTRRMWSFCEGWDSCNNLHQVPNQNKFTASLWTWPCIKTLFAILWFFSLLIIFFVFYNSAAFDKGGKPLSQSNQCCCLETLHYMLWLCMKTLCQQSFLDVKVVPCIWFSIASLQSISCLVFFIF